MDILDTPTRQQLEEENDRLRSAIRRAQSCLIDGRRIGDALQVLKVACPQIILGDGLGGGTPKKPA